jgi:hypothetical protein
MAVQLDLRDAIEVIHAVDASNFERWPARPQLA